MTEHLLSLAAKHRISVTWVSGWRKAEAFPDARTAALPNIRKPSDYLFGLHELGHIAAREARTRDGGGAYCDILSEGASWAWAATNALPSLARHLRAEDWNRVAYAFRSYLHFTAISSQESRRPSV